MHSGEDNGIITGDNTELVGDDVYDENVSREIDGENRQSGAQTANARAESQAEGVRRGTEEAFQGRTAQATARSRRRYVLKLNEGTENEASIEYTTKGADNSEAYRTVEVLRNKGYDAEYCDGSINTTDKNGNVSPHNNALTIQNGKVLVSSNCEGSAEQTADHEEIHILQRINNQAFVEYETAVCENIIFDNEAYIVAAKEINKDHHFVDENIIKTNEELEEELLTLSVMDKTLNELLAYLRQCYNYDADLAKEKYGGMFKNWDEVAAAIDKLNDAVGRNIPETTVLQSSAKDGARETVDLGGIDTDKARHLNRAEQERIREIGERLGRKVIYKDFYSLDKFKDKKKVPDGYIDGNGDIYINFYAKRPIQFIFKHEITHYLKRSLPSYQDFMDMVLGSKAFEDWLHSKGYASIDELKAEITDTYSEVKGFNEEKCYDEILADFCAGYLFGGEKAVSQKLIDAMEPKKRRKFREVMEDILAFLKGIFVKDELEVQIANIEDAFIKVYNKAVKAENSTDESYSFAGYAEDGKGKYKSNFPKGTPKSAKGEKILKYIQDVWSKKPIRLKIEENGNVRYIDAHFDPTFDESGNILTDASKLMGGNRHGTSAEQRVTLDLADDYYQIASESKYNYSKNETGKDNPAHKDVTKWHYFVNDIYFAEYDTEYYEPYRVSINVKEKSDGEYVYSFSAEKQRESDTPRTLHAVVNEGENSNANAELSNNRLAQNKSTVKNNSMQESEDYSIPTDTYSGEDLKDTPNELKPQSSREWSAFNRSFANQTNGLQNGERKNIIIHTAEAQYVVVTDGYMSGTIVIKNSIDEYNEMEAFVNDYTSSKVFSGSNDRYGNRQRDYHNDNNQLENGDTDSFYVELDSFIREHTQQFDNIRQTRSDSGGKQADVDYSIPTESATDLLDRYDKGEITRDEFIEKISRKKTLNPAEIANTKEEDANTTPLLKRKQGESKNIVCCYGFYRKKWI